MSLSTQVRAILSRSYKTPEQQDAAHAEWLQQPESVIAVIRQPVLAITPSKRTVDDNRDILIDKIRGYSNGK